MFWTYALVFFVLYFFIPFWAFAVATYTREGPLAEDIWFAFCWFRPRNWAHIRAHSKEMALEYCRRLFEDGPADPIDFL